jgi:hypothetical protein
MAYNISMDTKEDLVELTEMKAHLINGEVLEGIFCKDGESAFILVNKHIRYKVYYSSVLYYQYEVTK